MLTGKKKLLVLSVLTAITSVDFVCNANAEELKSYKLSEIIVEGRIDPNSTYDGTDYSYWWRCNCNYKSGN